MSDKRAKAVSDGYMRLLIACESADGCHERHPTVSADITVPTATVRAVLGELDAAREESRRMRELIEEVAEQIHREGYKAWAGAVRNTAAGITPGEPT